MPSRKGNLVLCWVATTLALALFILTGCVEVQVVDTIPAAGLSKTFTSPLPAASGERNLAVMAVDFDPPLSYRQLLLHRQAVSLLVVIENSGGQSERNIQVQAQLSTVEDPGLRLAQAAMVESIAPGEIQIVRFAPLEEIPFHRVYRLEVMVDPVDGEKDLADNRKAFDIQIHQEQDN
jgi:hypothetical protein